MAQRGGPVLMPLTRDSGKVGLDLRCGIGGRKRFGDAARPSGYDARHASDAWYVSASADACDATQAAGRTSDSRRATCSGGNSECASGTSGNAKSASASRSCYNSGCASLSGDTSTTSGEVAQPRN